MSDLMIFRKDNKPVKFDGAGSYYWIEAFGMWCKVMCMAVLNQELKHFRPVIYMDETNVRTFDYCGGK